jgi:hypothetical protein
MPAIAKIKMIVGTKRMRSSRTSKNFTILSGLGNLDWNGLPFCTRVHTAGHRKSSRSGQLWCECLEDDHDFGNTLHEGSRSVGCDSLIGEQLSISTAVVHDTFNTDRVHSRKPFCFIENTSEHKNPLWRPRRNHPILSLSEVRWRTRMQRLWKARLTITCSRSC